MNKLPLVFIATSFVYLSVAAENVSDKNFLMFRDYLSINVGLPLPGGYVELPGVAYSISLPEFFVAAPLAVFGLHVLGLSRLAYRPVDPGSQMLAALVLLGAPVALLVIARSYAPFPAIQPDTGDDLLRYWLVLFHILLIVVDWLALLAISTRWRDVPAVQVATVVVAAVAAFGLLGLVGDLRAARDDSDAAQRMREIRPVLAIAFALAGLVAVPAVVGRFGREPLAMIAAVMAWPALQRVIGPAPARYLNQTKESIPMPMRIAAVAFTLFAGLQVAHARGIDVSGETLAAHMPSESLIAAYVAGEVRSREFNAWSRAIGDHARGIDLGGWRLARADFTNAVMPKVILRGTQLRGAKLDFTLLPGADLTGVSAQKASFRYVDFHPVLVAQNGSDFSTAKLNDADFTGADLRNAIFQQLSNEVAETGSIECGEIEHPTTLNGMVLQDADLTGAFLDGVDFRELGSIKGAIFDGAKLRCAIFDEEDLGPMSFTKEADLRKASFCKAKLNDLSDATEPSPTPQVPEGADVVQAGVSPCAPGAN